MDSYDRHILRVLQRDGRISNRNLAQAVALSTTPCWRRVRELEASGVIDCYTAVVKPEHIGLTLTVIAQVELEDHHQSSVAAFREVVGALPEVMECLMVSGDYDYLLKVVAPDMTAYTRLLSERLLPLSYVHRVSSNFVMGVEKDTHELPVFDDVAR